MTKKPYYPTKGGVLVRSKGEVRIANLLYDNDIVFQYEKPTEVGKYTFTPDFYLKEFDIYIEYFGMIKGNIKYTKKTKWKRWMYRKHGYKLISLYPKHIYHKKEDQILIFIIAGVKSLYKLE